MLQQEGKENIFKRAIKSLASEISSFTKSQYNQEDYENNEGKTKKEDISKNEQQTDISKESQLSQNQHQLDPNNLDDSDTLIADNITAKFAVKISELKNIMQTMYQLTNADKLDTAVALIWYKFDPATDKEIAKMASLITVLYRCAKDGSIEPPLDMEEFYTKVNGLPFERKTAISL